MGKHSLVACASARAGTRDRILISWNEQEHNDIARRVGFHFARADVAPANGSCHGVRVDLGAQNVRMETECAVAVQENSPRGRKTPQSLVRECENQQDGQRPLDHLLTPSRLTRNIPNRVV